MRDVSLSVKPMTSNVNHGDHARQLAQDVAASYEARVAFVRAVVEETHELLERFRSERERMAAVLRESLAKSESLRKSDFNRMMDGILTVQRAREEGVQAMLQRFREDEERVVERLRGLLARGAHIQLKDFTRTLAQIRADQQQRTQETVAGVDERLTLMRQEVGAICEEFKREREKMRAEQPPARRESLEVGGMPVAPAGDRAGGIREGALVGSNH